MENLVQEKAEHKQHIEAATAVPGEFQEEPGQQPQAKQLSMVGIVSISGSAPIIRIIVLFEQETEYKSARGALNLVGAGGTDGTLVQYRDAQFASERQN